MIALILAALNDLYNRLANDPSIDVPRMAYCAGNAGVVLEISADGELVRAVPLGTQKGKKTLPMRLVLPDRQKRSSGDAPNFLCDNAEYVLGVAADPGKQKSLERAARRHQLAKTLHNTILGDVQDNGAKAVLAFLNRWNPSDYPKNAKLDTVRDLLDSGANIVFRLAGDDCFIHDRPAIKRAWETYWTESASDSVWGQCLVTGEYGPVARLHKNITGIKGAKSTGASLVSFNFPAAESYGKSQGANSPVGQAAAFGYATALNWLTSNIRHHVQVGDTTIVFWAERSGPEENLLLDLFADAIGTFEAAETAESENATTLDKATSGKVKSLLERLLRGQSITDDMTIFEENVRFYILGLAPNAARISVRFWHVDTFGGLLKRLQQHFEDMSIDHREGEHPVSVGRLLLELAPAADRKSHAIPQTVIGSLFRAILQGTMYPRSIYALMIGRIRSDFNDPDRPWLERKVTYPRAAFIKAYLRRKARITGNKALEEVLTEMLNPENKEKGYLLGRLFALLEKAQQDANPEIKSTIKDRYYASASATPGTVFPVLLRLAQHHIAKSEYGGYVDKLIEEVMVHIDSFPPHLSLDQQGLFALGYYQQRAGLYKKAE
ncbi:MAG TPA: type I-C CRISPR-associated protein Cas8c/Csd1 [Firmicutes bacterium]|nr:type I-C CRISPR-associated protein Cas8c/Csd1 [Candidatus Fermentithermobacillaceae bacterium]